MKEWIDKYDKITIFMDIGMQIMKGIGAIRLIKDLDKKNQAKIVILSAFRGEEIIQECFHAGAIDFHLMPISFKKLKEMKESKLIIF